MAVFCVPICGGYGYEGKGREVKSQVRVIRGGREQGLRRIIDEEYCAVGAGCRLPAMESKRQEEYHEDISMVEGQGTIIRTKNTSTSEEGEAERGMEEVRASE